MILAPTTSREKKLQFIEALINNSTLVSKVSPNSVLSGVAAGIAKISQKSEKDIIIALSELMPDLAYGSQLDQLCLNFGIAPRFTTSGSSTYVLLRADPGTTYLQGTHILTSLEGTQFQFSETVVTMGSFGFQYEKVQSLTQGEETNVQPLTINNLTVVPVGHLYVTNEVQATGGRDLESDEDLRVRIKEGANILARGTLSSLEQKFMSINPKVLRCFYQGFALNGKIQIAIMTQNGQDLSGGELAALLVGSEEFLNLVDQPPFGTQFYGVELSNMSFTDVDVSFRIDYDLSYSLDKIRIDCQTLISKYLDFRYFDPSTQKVEWDNLLDLVKRVEGVKYIPDQYFYPRTDMLIQNNSFPRLRGFRMFDLDGNIIQDFAGVLSPVYYPNNYDFAFVQTILTP